MNRILNRVLKGSFILIFLLQMGILSAQTYTYPKPERNVPVIVVERFKDKFPSKEPVWFSQYQGRYDQRLVYEGRFIFDNRYSSAIYDKEGNLIAFAASVDKNEIPVAIIKYMNEKFPSLQIVDAILVTRGKDAVTYEIGVYVDNQYVIKVFTKDGNFIKSTRA